MNCGNGVPTFSPKKKKKKSYYGIPEKRNTLRQVLIYQINVLELERDLWAHPEWLDNPHRIK